MNTVVVVVVVLQQQHRTYVRVQTLTQPTAMCSSSSFRCSQIVYKRLRCLARNNALLGYSDSYSYCSAVCTLPCIESKVWNLPTLKPWAESKIRSRVKYYPPLSTAVQHNFASWAELITFKLHFWALRNGGGGGSFFSLKKNRQFIYFLFKKKKKLLILYGSPRRQQQQQDKDEKRAERNGDFRRITNERMDGWAASGLSYANRRRLGRYHRVYRNILESK